MPTAAADVAHLLRRAEFGATNDRIAALAAMDLPAVVDTVLNTASNPPDNPPPELSDTTKGNYERFVALTQQWYDRMATSPTPIVEKMTLFWHGHFTTQLDKIDRTPVMREQISMYRKNALGNFQTLSQAMAIEPAMIMYLDNDSNRKGQPNQNFARELLELFLLGVGNYIEADVEAAARAWTGHGVNVDDATDTATYVFNAKQHDTGNKTFLGATKNLDGPDTITHIFTTEPYRTIMAQFIVAKLWTFFAAPDPPAAVVDALAQVFIANNFELTPLLRALFLRGEFYSPAVNTGLVRSPVEWITSILRGTGLTASDLNPQWWATEIGQELFNPPNVAGWKNNLYWVSTSAAGARAQFVNYTAFKMGGDKTTPKVLIDTTAMTPPDAAKAVLDQFHVSSPAAHTNQVLVDFITAQRASNQNWPEPGNLARLVMLSPDLQMA